MSQTVIAPLPGPAFADPDAPARALHVVEAAGLAGFMAGQTVNHHSLVGAYSLTATGGEGQGLPQCFSHT